MQVNSCLLIIPSADLERSLRFWVDGLGFTYGQSEFFVTDDDGYSHCFGVPTGQGPI